MTIRACWNLNSQHGYSECKNNLCQNSKHMEFDSYLSLLQYDIAMSMSCGDLSDLKKYCETAPLLFFPDSRAKATSMVDNLSEGHASGGRFIELMLDWGMHEKLSTFVCNYSSGKASDERDLIILAKQWLVDRVCVSLGQGSLVGNNYPLEFIRELLKSSLRLLGMNNIFSVEQYLEDILSYPVEK